MRRRNNNPNLAFFLMIIFLFGGAPLLGVGISFVTSLLPFILLVYGASWLAKKIRENVLNNPDKNTGFNNKTRPTATTINLSNHDKNLIDNRLRDYFSKHINLPIFENVVLTTQSGSYTSIEDLYLSLGEEKILSLNDFRNYNPSQYNTIISLLLAFAKQKEEVMTSEIKTTNIKEEDKLSDAQKYIDKINNLNSALPNEEISNGLHQTCDLLKQIDLASEKDGKDSKLNKLYDYYLPILTNILDNYNNLAKTSSTDSKDFKDVETQLLKTIILINEALKSIKESLHEDDYMNLSADITTLQSLLQKDGYAQDPFKEKKDA